MPNEELINSYIDRSAIKKETEETITDLNSLLEAFNKLKSTLSGVGSATNMQAAAAAVKDYSGDVGNLTARLTAMLTVDTSIAKAEKDKALATKEGTAATKEQAAAITLNAQAYDKLVAQLDKAKAKVIELSTAKVLDIQALDAATAKVQKLESALLLLKQKADPANTSIPFTHNLNEVNATALSLQGQPVTDPAEEETASIARQRKFEQMDADRKKAFQASQALDEAQKKEIETIRQSEAADSARFAQFDADIAKQISLENELAQKKEAVNGIKANIDLRGGEATNPETQQLVKLRREMELTAAESTNLSKSIKTQAATFITDADSTNVLEEKITGIKTAFAALTVEERAQAEALQTSITNRNNLQSQLSENKGLQKNITTSVAANGGESTEKQQTDLSTLQVKAEALDAAIKALNTTIRNQAKEFIAATGSIDSMQARLNGLQQTYTAMAPEIKASPIGVQMADEIKLLNEQLVKAENELGKFGRSVGNYKTAIDGVGIADSGSRFVNLTGALTTLKNGLDEAKVKMQELSAAGLQESQEGQFTAKEISLLTVLVDQQEKGFSSLTRELYNTEKALGTLQAAGLDDTEVFETLSNQIAKAHQNLNIFNEGQKNMEKSFPGIHVLANSIQELSSAYSVATAATALLSDSDEELQKKMGKFNALLTLGISLQQFATSVEKESATVRLVQVARINLMNAAKSVENVLFGRSAQAKTAEAAAAAADAAAQEELASATAAGTTAQAESVVATEGATVAMEGEAVAATEAAVATKTFATGFIATGIGAAIVAVGVALAFLVSKVNEYVSKGIAALKLSSDLADATKTLNATLLEQASLFSDNDDTQKKALEGFLELEQKRGANSISQFAARKNIYEEESNLIKEQIKDLQKLGIATDGVAQARRKTELQSLTAQKAIYNQNIITATTNKDDRSVTANQKLSDDAQKQIDAIKPIYDAVNALNTKQVENKKATDGLQIEEEKFTVDQQRAIVLEGANQKAAIIKAANDSILSNDRSSLTQRLNAIRSSANAEKSVLETQRGELNKQQSAGTIDGAEYLNGINAINEKEKELTIKEKDDLYQQVEADRIKSLEAHKEIANSDLAIEENINKEISATTELELSKRLDAYKKYVADKQAALNNDFDTSLKETGFNDKEIEQLKETGQFEIAGKKKTYDEITAMVRTYENGLLQLSIDTTKGTTDILKAELTKQQNLRAEDVAYIKQLYATLDATIDTNYAKGIINLNNQFGEGKIGLSKYLTDRKRLEESYQEDISKETINSLQDQLKQYTGVKEQEAEAAKKLHQLEQEFNDPGKTDVEKESIASEIQLQAASLKAAQKAVAEKTTLETQLADAIVNAEKKKQQAISDTDKLVKETRKNLLNSLADFARGLAENSYARQNNLIQAQMDLLDKRTQKEIDAVNQSVASQDAKDKQIATINARSAAQKDALDNRQKAAEVERAKLEKEASLMRIAITTAEAVFKIEAQAAVNETLPPPIGQILHAIALSQIPLVIATGALEAAVVASTPLPKYFAGTENHAGGLAIVGDGGKKELVIEPTGKIWETPDKPTVVNLPKHTIVKPEVPDPKKMLALQMQFAKSKTDSILAQSHTLNQNYTIDSTAIINNNNKNARYIAKAIAENKPTIIQEGNNREILMKYGASYHKHI